MRPISKTQRIIKNYSDNSYEISILITNDNEIIPTIKKFMPHIRVINNQRIDNKIKKDFEEYFKVI
jgi:predicted DNA-binding transcriptional regulator YafY